MKLKIDNKGVSLALVIGLFLLLVIITTTVNELVIRALRASHQIEASDKAYFAAEAGIENSLYELSAHAAGYETVDFTEPDARNDDFTEAVNWTNRWEIKNKDLNDCSVFAAWEDGYTPTYCGKVTEGSKLVINLFTDDALSVGIDTDQVNEAVADIHTLSVSAITVKFRLPTTVVVANAGAWASGLLIDNDGDLGTSSEAGADAILGLNEDGHEDFGFAPDTCPYSGTVDVDDGDCDGKEDEDSHEDPVILWKIIDGSGGSFQPLRGCKGDPEHASHVGSANAGLCEKNFTLTGDELVVSLSETDLGVDQTGTIRTLQSFLGDYFGVFEALQMEILVVSPMTAVDVSDSSTIPIPYYEYGITYTEDGGATIPATFFSLRSDGYFRDFKQSITTNVVPRATTRLLDLTIIQQ